MGMLFIPSVATIADGIAVKKPGDLTYELCSKYVDDIVTVTDDEISAAILALMEQHKLIAEGAGAVSVAAAMFKKVDLQGMKFVFPTPLMLCPPREKPRPLWLSFTMTSIIFQEVRG